MTSPWNFTEMPVLTPDAGKIRFAEDIVEDIRGGGRRSGGRSRRGGGGGLASALAVQPKRQPSTEGSNLPRKRHIPERTCVTCGSKKPKRELVRIASSPEGQVSVDVTGKAPGRGAYVCGADCWDTALGPGAIGAQLGQATLQE